MFDPDGLPELRKTLADRIHSDQKLFDQLRAEVQELKGRVRSIKPRSVTATSLVATDAGNNKIAFDPFLVQLVRVVDSYGKQLFLDAVSPTSDTDILSDSQFDVTGAPKTPLGRVMVDLGKKKLSDLSHMIPAGKRTREEPETVSPSWVLVYRDLCEWAVLYDRICYHTFATDTLIVRDGLLRSKLFREELFIELMNKIATAMERTQKEDKRRLFLVGLAKHSKVLSRYQLALAIEDILPGGDPVYVEIPRKLEAKAYVWPEYARGTEAGGEGEAPKFVAGTLHLVRFGNRKADPIWAVDIFQPQSDPKLVAEIFGYLLADAINGFPVPLYPRCLQRAHEHAELVGFDMDIMQEEIFAGIRNALPTEKRTVLDEFRLNPDPSGRRYE